MEVRGISFRKNDKQEIFMRVYREDFITYLNSQQVDDHGIVLLKLIPLTAPSPKKYSHYAVLCNDKNS